MRAIYTCVWLTKAEAASPTISGVTTVAPKAYFSSAAAKAALSGPVQAGTASYGRLSGPNGLIRTVYNPAGA